MSGTAIAPARRAALALLGEQRRRQAHVRDLMRTSPTVANLDERDRSLASRLALGVVAASGALDALIDCHLSRGSRLEPRVRDALRLSSYELCWLQTPSAVAVSQGVELVRSVAPRAAGLANAVLRRVADTDVPARAAALARVRAGAADVSDLAAVSGYPTWLLDEVCASRGRAATDDFALASLEAPPVYVAANRALHGPGETRRLLEEAGTEPVPTGLPDSFALGAPARLAPSGLVESTDVVVADLSAQLVARLCAPRPGERVLEVGQGRATKTLLLQGAACEQGGPVELVGIDAEPFKVRVAERRAARAGLSAQVRCLAFDARRLADGASLPPELSGSFDLVFVDAPCSGSGTLRRHPELPWRLSREALGGAGSLPELQLAILSASVARLRPGGLLAYATCSVLQRENEAAVEALLSSPAGRDLHVESVATLAQERRLPLGQRWQSALTPEGYLQTAVAPDGPDGHFCACLRRRS